jgi:hypothetical protein
MYIHTRRLRFLQNNPQVLLGVTRSHLVHSAAAAAEKTAAATAVLYMAAALHTAAAELAAVEMAADSEEYHNSFHSNAPHTRKKSACHYVVTCLLQGPYTSVASNRYRSTSTHSCVISSRLLARALRLRRFVRQPFHSETSRLANRLHRHRSHRAIRTLLQKTTDTRGTFFLKRIGG